MNVEVTTMRTAKWAVRRLHVQPTLNRFAEDMGDLRDAVTRNEWDVVRLKASDVMLTGWCMLYRFTRISLPIIGGCRAAKEIIRQIPAWSRIIRAGFGVDIPAAELGKYLETGSDTNRPPRVQQVMWKVAGDRLDLSLTVEGMNRALVTARTQPSYATSATNRRRRRAFTW